MGAYGDYGTELAEQGFPVIPLNGKIPAIKEWQKYCSEELPSELREAMAETHADCNIGLPLGKESGLVGFDIDLDELVKPIADMLPKTAFIKKGKKGLTFFYKYDGKLSSQAFRHKGVHCFDILSTSRQTVLPPSIHPDTGLEYTWEGPDLSKLDDFGPPLLTQEIIDAVKAKIRGVEIENDLSGGDTTLGRNERLKPICQAMIGRGHSADYILNELLIEDAKHAKPLFEDPKEPYYDGNAYTAAMKFYLSIQKSVDAERISRGESTENPLARVDSVDAIDVSEEKEIVYPIPQNIMGEIVQWINETAHVENTTAALAGAVSLMGALACNRVKHDETYPNVYCLTLARSGSGKERPQKAIIEILYDLDFTDLVGSDYYTSDTAILQDLTDQKNVRIDTLDEVDAYFRMANDKKGSAYQYAIGSTYAKLWSASDSYHLGKVKAKSKDTENNIGKCRHPCINLLCSTTLDGFSESITRESIKKGFAARFLIFKSLSKNKLKRTVSGAKFNTTSLENFFKDNPIGYQPLVNFPKPVTLELSEGGNQFDKQIFEYLNEKRITTPDSAIEVEFVNRQYQQYKKLAQIHCLARSIDEARGYQTLDRIDFQWAFDMTEKMIVDIRDNMGKDLGNGPEAVVYRIISSSGTVGVYKKDLRQQTGFKSAGLNSSLQSLIEDGMIKRVIDSDVKGKGRRPEKFYALRI